MRVNSNIQEPVRWTEHKKDVKRTPRYVCWNSGY
jgi:hypothetical protein